MTVRPVKQEGGGGSVTTDSTEETDGEQGGNGRRGLSLCVRADGREAPGGR